MLSFAAAAGSLAWLVARLSGSLSAALAALAVFVYQPDLLYLQATPMTEPLLLGLTVTGIALLCQWTRSGGTGSAWPAGLALALACLTRYEAWPMTAAAGLVSWLTLWRNGGGPVRSLGAVLRVGAWPLGALLLFLVLSKATVGAWLVTGGFYEPNNPAYRVPSQALVQVGWGLGRVGGWPVAWAGAAGALRRAAARPGAAGPTGLVVRPGAGRQRRPALLRLRERPPVPHPLHDPADHGRRRPASACSWRCCPSPIDRWCCCVILGVLAFERQPLGLTSPMVAEAQWDRANQTGTARRHPAA